jgi:hypothetical protein
LEYNAKQFEKNQKVGLIRILWGKNKQATFGLGGFRGKKRGNNRFRCKTNEIVFPKKSRGREREGYGSLENEREKCVVLGSGY